MPERPTLADVADAAGVSRATVSKVLNGRHDVSAQTRTRVEQLLVEHAYVRRGTGPDGDGRAGSRRMVQLVVDTLASPYTLELIRGVSDAADEAGLEVVLSRSSGDRDGRWVQRAAGGARRGLILVMSKISEEQRATLAGAGVPLVMIDPLVVPDDVPSIGVTNWAGGLAATEHLIALGHTRIGVLAGHPDVSSATARVHGFRAALANAGLEADPQLIRPADFGFDRARQNAQAMLALDRPPTAVFATSDGQALGALAAARELGLGVPHDVSVIGFDGLSVSRFSSPPLTTIQTPLADMGRTAVGMIRRMAGGDRLDTMRVELATRLVVRESTGPPRPA
jgi:LacI family transcriptional regulator, galactose operon repressor